MVRVQRLAQFFEEHFSGVELHLPEQQGSEGDKPLLIIWLDGVAAQVNLETLVSQLCTLFWGMN
jgi:hypothetical protein